MLRKFKIFAFLFFLPLLAEAQCAMCKAVVENGDTTMAEGVNSGITYLMVFPYILIAVLFYFIYRYKKAPKN